MTDSPNRTIYLLSQYAADLCTDSEIDELFDIIKAFRDDEDLHRFLEAEWLKLQPSIQKQPDWNRMFEGIIKKPGVVSDRLQAERVRKMGWIKWVAAAAIITVIAGAWWWIRETANGKRQINTEVAHDVAAPKETRAVITLANGSKVYLDSVNTGTIAQESNVNVVKDANGGIKYLSPAGGGELSASPNNKRLGVVYNELFNPRGSKVISLTLSDGTKVWLNSESSLRYPASFAPSAVNREVEITGEAYFEVKHNSKQPFKVHLPNGSIVEDIGTSFNINSYPDEGDIKTTLIEGSVKVSASSAASAFIKPGEQAIINHANPKITRIEVQTDDVVAWVNGQFSYTNTDLETIMRQMARWYDVEVEYKDKITDRYTVDVPRTVPVSQLFKFIEMSGGVHFTIEAKKITVSK